MEHERLPRRRHLDTARRAVEKLHAVLVLELAHAAARRGERDVRSARGLRDALHFGDADEEREGSEVGASHVATLMYSGKKAFWRERAAQPARERPRLALELARKELRAERR